MPYCKLTTLSLLIFSLAISTACEDFEGEFGSGSNDRFNLSSDICSKTNGAKECEPYEAEDYSGTSGCQKATNHTGYTGSGFVDFGGNGTWIEWKNIAAPVAGEYTLTFRYANGGSGNRQAAVYVGGQQAGNVPFAKTDDWKNWKTATFKVSLRQGNNTIRVQANTGSGGPNLDNMLVVGKDLIGDNCPNDPKKSEPGICGCGVPEGSCDNGGNIALGKSTRQSSTAYRGESSRAVDGNTSGRYGDGSTTHTENESKPWWQVDLGAAYRVQGLTLYNRTDCCSDRLSNFHVDLLGENGSVVATKNFAGQAGAKTVIDISASGVYSVRIQLNGTNPLSLAEVQVSGSRDTVGGGTSLCAEANENKTATLSCPSGKTINTIEFASYGLPTGSCEQGFVKGSCHAGSSDYIVKTNCLKKQSCTVNASNGTFGDPCSGKYKKIAIAYTCSGGGGDDNNDNNDKCPNDPNKTEPGICGCGVPEGTCNDDDPDPVTDGPLDKASNTKLRIASWNNFRGSIFPKTSSLWRAINTSGKYHVTRTEGAARLIEAVDADIWLMQETCYSSSGLPSGISKGDVNNQIASYMRSLTGDSWQVSCNGRGLCTMVRGSLRFDGHWEKGTRVTGDRVILPNNTKVLLMNVHYMDSSHATDTKSIIEDIGPTVSSVFVGGDFNDGQGGSRYNIIDNISGMNNLSMYHWKDPHADHLTSSLQNGQHKNTKGYMKWGNGPAGQDIVTSIGGGHIDHFFLKSNSWRAGNRFILNTLLFAPETLDLYGLEPLDIALQPQYYLNYFRDFMTHGIIYEIPANAYDSGSGLDHDHLPMIVDFTW